MKIGSFVKLSIKIFENIKDLCVYLQTNTIFSINNTFEKIISLINQHDEKLEKINGLISGKDIVGVRIGTNNSAPDNTQILNKEIVFYLDENGNKLKVKVRYSNGTLKNGEINLT